MRADSHFYVLADVFTERPFGGNPLAVFPEADGVAPERMARLARELNLAECAFILAPEDPRHTCRVRIFTPAEELPFAGHPTVGAACVLAYLRGDAARGGARYVFEEGIGPVEVEVERRGGGTYARLTLPGPPEWGMEAPSAEEAAALLSLEPEAVVGGDAGPEAVSCGVPYLLIRVRDRAALGRLRIDEAVWARLVDGRWARQVYVFTEDAEWVGSSYRARMFTRWAGLVEDAATGSAAAALAGYLARRAGPEAGRLEWTVEQGIELGRPSLIRIEAEKRDGRVAVVRVGGNAVVMGQGTLRPPAE